MITRIGTVVICILTAVWLARAPDWEPLIAFLVALGSYAGIELRQRSKKEDSHHDPHASVPKHEPEKQIEAPDDVPLSPEAFTVLRLAVDAYPKRLRYEHFKERTKFSDLDLQLALAELKKRIFLGDPEGGLWNTRDPDPNQPDPQGYQLLEAGARFAKKKKTSSPALARQPNRRRSWLWDY